MIRKLRLSLLLFGIPAGRIPGILPVRTLPSRAGILRLSFFILRLFAFRHHPRLFSGRIFLCRLTAVFSLCRSDIVFLRFRIRGNCRPFCRRCPAAAAA